MPPLTEDSTLSNSKAWRSLSTTSRLMPRCSSSFLEKRLILVYVVPRERSGHVIEEQSRNVVLKNQSTIEALLRSKELAREMKKSLLCKDIDRMGRLLERCVAGKKTVCGVNIEPHDRSPAGRSSASRRAGRQDQRRRRRRIHVLYCRLKIASWFPELSQGMQPDPGIRSLRPSGMRRVDHRLRLAVSNFLLWPAALRVRRCSPPLSHSAIDMGCTAKIK